MWLNEQIPDILFCNDSHICISPLIKNKVSTHSLLSTYLQSVIPSVKRKFCLSSCEGPSVRSTTTRLSTVRLLKHWGKIVAIESHYEKDQYNCEHSRWKRNLVISL